MQDQGCVWGKDSPRQAVGGGRIATNHTHRCAKYTILLDRLHTAINKLNGKTRDSMMDDLGDGEDAEVPGSWQGTLVCFLHSKSCSTAWQLE
ncbi:hypothetical protein IAQ61_007114 [Plenodomus lingam]|uniref:uncharacterized protein n=1 Tax=Leptosphaeria maculans TaxID=5022 RepID=UPI0033187E11|nr:hypothetical protein IAQ61_007114 [Plenodomus lingam]